MNYQDKVKDQQPSAFFPDGSASRAPIPGTVAEEMPAKGDYWSTGKWDETHWGTGIPVHNSIDGAAPLQIDAANMARGRERYTISCEVCHGAAGDGKGITSKYGLNGAANYHQDMYRTMSDGEIFNTISNGKGQMLGYGYNVTIDDRWRIIMYIRALQRSQNATLDDASPDEQSALQAKLKPAAPAPAPAPDAQPAPAPATPPAKSASNSSLKKLIVYDLPATLINDNGIVAMESSYTENFSRPGAANQKNPVPTMSGHPHTIHLPPPERLVPGKFALTSIFAVLAIVGLILSAIGCAIDHVQFAYSWFFALYFYFTIALGSFFWVTLHYACDSDWTVLVRRTWENVLALFPLLFVLFIPLLLPGMSDTLWKYMTPENQATLNHAKDWLNPTSFFIRWVFYALYFCLAGLYYRRHSILQDTDGKPRPYPPDA